MIHIHATHFEVWDVEELADHPHPTSEIGEDEIMVALVLADGERLDHEALLAHCRERMAAFHVPWFIRVVEQLPRTQTERVEKYKLRAQGVTPDTLDVNAAR